VNDNLKKYVQLIVALPLLLLAAWGTAAKSGTSPAKPPLSRAGRPELNSSTPNKKPEKKVEPTPPNAERDAVDEALGKRAIDEFRNAVATRLTKARATLDDNKKGKLIELLCGSQAIADLCKKTACDVPISAEFLMKPDHAAWTTLAQALNSLKMDQFRKLLAAASA